MKALSCILLLLTVQLRAAEADPAPTFEFDLPALQLDEALQRFAAQSGASTGMSGRMPVITTRAIRGRYSAEEALARMLEGSAIEVVATGPGAFRLQRRRLAPAVSVQPTGTGQVELAEVMVTASKRMRSLRESPLSLSVVGFDGIQDVGVMPGTGAVLDLDAATSSTNNGPGRNRHFIRGIADSPFLGPSQATVSVQYDEARLNYSAPDPDIRLLDVERVEILEGPQGPLYGTGALGGVVHIVPRRPDPATAAWSATAAVGNTSSGQTRPGAAAMLNLPLARDVLGLRVVAYGADESGWIDNTDGRSDANSTQVRGARMSLRGQWGGWVADLQGLAQVSTTDDSQYVTGTGSGLSRSGILPEPRDNDIYLVSGAVHGPLWNGELLLGSSQVRHEVDDWLDASASAPEFGLTGPVRYHDARDYRLQTSEVRFTKGGRVPWLVGIAHLSARSTAIGSLEPAPVQGPVVSDLTRYTTEIALFGEATLPLGRGFNATAGLRLSRVSDEDEQLQVIAEREGSVVHAATPSVSLDWRSADQRRFLYLRFAQAVRPGGLNPDGSGESSRYRSDELSSLDLGSRLSLRDDSLSLDSTVFATRWRHVQSDYLLPNGLVGTRNAGLAHNVGVESQLHADLARGFALELGAILQHARLESPVIPVASADARLPVVPDARAHVALSQVVAMPGWSLRWTIRTDYVGASRLSFEQDLDRRTPQRFTAGLGLRLSRGRLVLRLDADNLFNSRADTFAFGNPFLIRHADLRTPLQPRTLALRVERSW